MSKTVFAALVAALAMSPALFAADAKAPKAEPAKVDKPAAAPVRPAELAALDYFGGDWSCSGKAFASPMGPEHATTASVHAAWSVGNMWLHVDYDEKKSAANPQPYHVGVYMGYDAGKKEFVEGCVDGLGGYCTEASPGWNGDTLVFEGKANGGGQEYVARDTFVKKSATEFTHAGSMQDANKQWTDTDQETCRKGK
ncbi:MAG TPA: DUF1579 family protein [Rudaea sp.]|nr:DUF1579 family protein [Rudaea sp.]